LSILKWYCPHKIISNIFLDGAAMAHRPFPIAIYGVTGIILIFCFWFVTPGHATVNPSMKKSSKAEVGKGPKTQVRLIDLGV